MKPLALRSGWTFDCADHPIIQAQGTIYFLLVALPWSLHRLGRFHVGGFDTSGRRLYTAVVNEGGIEL